MPKRLEAIDSDDLHEERSGPDQTPDSVNRSNIDQPIGIRPSSRQLGGASSGRHAGAISS